MTQFLKRHAIFCALAGHIVAAGPAHATDPTDIIATIPTSPGTLLTATIRPDEVACISLLGPQSWLVFTPSSQELSLIDTSLKVRTPLNKTSLAAFAESLARDATRLRDTLEKLRTHPRTPPEVKKIIDQYRDAKPGTTVPPVTLVATPLQGSVVFAEIQVLNKHLTAFRADMRTQLPDAVHAIETLRCAHEFDYVPSQLRAPNTANTTTVTAMKPANPTNKSSEAVKDATLYEVFTRQQ